MTSGVLCSIFRSRNELSIPRRIPLSSFVRGDDSAWWVFQHCEKGDGSAWCFCCCCCCCCCCCTSGLVAKWYKMACTIAIRHLRSMRNGEATTKRARMRFISTQMFGERRYETLPMRDCKHSTAEEQNGQNWNILRRWVPNTGEREVGILRCRMRGMVPRRMHAHTKTSFEEKF